MVHEINLSNQLSCLMHKLKLGSLFKTKFSLCIAVIGEARDICSHIYCSFRNIYIYKYIDKSILCMWISSYSQVFLIVHPYMRNNVKI